tara:strand:- start:297 stop:698 length:402 start_codon:yes stop_codon:yes gene_type:complete
MVSKFLKKIIAKDQTGLNTISAICSESKIKTGDIKFLKKNKIFLLLIERLNKEDGNKAKKINSILKFEYISASKSKNIDQNINDTILELISINLFKKDENYEITLLFLNNVIITLTAEIIEVTLEDQKLNEKD